MSRVYLRKANTRSHYIKFSKTTSMFQCCKYYDLLIDIKRTSEVLVTFFQAVQYIVHCTHTSSQFDSWLPKLLYISSSLSNYVTNEVIE